MSNQEKSIHVDGSINAQDALYTNEEVSNRNKTRKLFFFFVMVTPSFIFGVAFDNYMFTISL